MLLPMGLQVALFLAVNLLYLKFLFYMPIKATQPKISELCHLILPKKNSSNY